IVQVTPLGRKVYSDYSDYILAGHFSKMFDAGQKIPREYLPAIADMLDAGMHADCAVEPPAPVLIPILTPRQKEADHG
ncbi:MAG: hypothetical protein RR216_08060, partial [Pseudoflavonifractor sp.]